MILNCIDTTPVSVVGAPFHMLMVLQPDKLYANIKQ